MKKTSYIISGTILVSIGVVTGLISLSLNVAHGYQTSIIIALILFLAEAGRIAIPVVGVLHGWNTGMKLILGTCAVASLAAAFTNFADVNADRLLAVETQNGAHDRAQAAFEAIRAELAGFKISENVSGLEALAAVQKDKAAKEAARGFCGPKCQAAEKEYGETIAKLALANRKAELETKLASAKVELDHTQKAQASGVVRFVVAFTGAQTEKVAMAEGFFWGILAILIVEQLVYLPILGFKYLLIGLGKIEEEVEKVVEAVLPAASREEEALQQLVSMILRAGDDGIITSGRQLAEQLDVKPSTLAEWLKKWTGQGGKIRAIQINAHKKRFSLAA